MAPVEERSYFFGAAWINVSTPASLLRSFEEAFAVGRPITVGHHNLHSLYYLEKSPGMADYYSSCDFCYLDGWGAALAGNLAGSQPLSRFERMTLLDWWPDLSAWAIRHDVDIFYFGGKTASVENGLKRLRETFPRLRIEGWDGFSSDSIVRSRGAETGRRSLLLVGLGMPLQEAWVARHRRLLNFDIVMTTGGFIDYFSGEKRLPPRFLGRFGLEWFFRLCDEPRRLSFRYLVEPWAVVASALGHRLRGTASVFSVVKSNSGE